MNYPLGGAGHIPCIPKIFHLWKNSASINLPRSANMLHMGAILVARWGVALF